MQSTDCFVFVSNFNPSRTPTGGGKKFYLTHSTGSTPPLSSAWNKSPLLFQRRFVAGEELT